MSNIPKKVFIIPYRDRKEQMHFFQKYMNLILADEMPDCELYFSHQHDKRPFNRGAVKNIGFLAIKSKYPNHYKDIDFIFNDVDTIPYKKIFPYETSHGVVAHYYGSETTMGGIVVIKGSDFELINGYPCLWSWGLEDAVLQERCIQHRLKIDRTSFYPIGSPEILQLFDGMKRLINKSECERGSNNPTDGLTTIKNLYYSLDKTSKNPSDASFLDEQENMFFINIFRFTTNFIHNKEGYSVYDVREPISTFFKKSYKNNITTDYENSIDWKSFDLPSQPLHNPKTFQHANKKIITKQIPKQNIIRQIPKQNIIRQIPNQNNIIRQQPNQNQNQNNNIKQPPRRGNLVFR